MDEEIFCHGKTGQWTYSISEIYEVGGVTSVSADIRYLNDHRCRLVVSRTDSTRAELVVLMKAKCFDWIEAAEGKARPLSAS